MKRSTKFIYFGFGLGLGLMVREIWRNADGVKQQLGPHAMTLLARGVSLEDLRNELEAVGNRMNQQLLDKMPSEYNYKQLNHIIGIERWGQSRLLVALGEQSLTMDEADDYAPQIGLSWNELQDIFAASRQQTVLLAERLIAADAAEVTVLHNEFGEFTALNWLIYLRTHANSELWKMN